jgi:hypothetical protein
MQQAWPRRPPLPPTSILFNANRARGPLAGWQEPVGADKYRQLVFKSTVK